MSTRPNSLAAPAPGKRRPYVRPMDDWWQKNPYFVEYMIHEGTALFVAAYALILLTGLVHLAQGEAQWNAWVLGLKHPLYIGFHLLALAALSYHTWTWFHIMPRTLPPMIVKGERVSGTVITRTGLIVAGIACASVLVAVWEVTK